MTIGLGLTEASACAWNLYLSEKAKDAEPARFAEPGIAVLKADGSIDALFLLNMPCARPSVDDLIKGLGFVIRNDDPLRGAA